MEALGAAALLGLALCLPAFGLYCCYVKYVHAKYDHVPGAPRERAEKYGPIVRLNAFHRVTVMILSPEGVKVLPNKAKSTVGIGPSLQKERRCLMFRTAQCSQSVPAERVALAGLGGFLGNGLVTVCNHEHWHKQRKIMDPSFSRNYLIGLMETFNEKAEELMEKLEEKADGKKEFSMLTMMNRVTMDIIAKVAFGLELNALSDDQTPFPHAVTMVLEGMTKARIPLVQYTPGKQKLVKEVKESVRLLRRVGKECIDQRREAIQNGKEATLDILTQILKGDALEETRDDENIVDNFITFFVAGHETTANQLSFTVMALAQHPEILERLQAEVDEVLGAKRDIDYEDLGKLTYLSQVLKESLRLYPPVPGTVRWMEKEHIIDGIRIPAKTTLVMEAKVVMAKLLQRFEFQLVPGQSFKLLDAGTLRPLDGVMCKLKPRSLARGCQV
ncbi:hypothetical protein QYF61_008855 [Mycteria americana]|uniref:Uncharacterized protein n=1 Tax=Mycteria americana TaxID=33587 RepID=A0AAN7S7P7_MYCAM|nr:hypothetical protein QYF61_008855 [Mycteria americana]